MTRNCVVPVKNKRVFLTFATIKKSELPKLVIKTAVTFETISLTSLH